MSKWRCRRARQRAPCAPSSTGSEQRGEPDGPDRTCDRGRVSAMGCRRDVGDQTVSVCSAAAILATSHCGVCQPAPRRVNRCSFGGYPRDARVGWLIQVEVRSVFLRAAASSASARARARRMTASAVSSGSETSSSSARSALSRSRRRLSSVCSRPERGSKGSVMSHRVKWLFRSVDIVYSSRTTARL